MRQKVLVLLQRAFIAVYWLITLLIILCLAGMIIQLIGYLFNANLLILIGLSMDKVLNFGFALTIAILLLPFIVPWSIRDGYLGELMKRIEIRKRK